jgi:hypothetical protein
MTVITQGYAYEKIPWSYKERKRQRERKTERERETERD